MSIKSYSKCDVANTFWTSSRAESAKNAKFDQIRSNPATRTPRRCEPRQSYIRNKVPCIGSLPTSYWCLEFRERHIRASFYRSAATTNNERPRQWTTRTTTTVFSIGRSIQAATSSYCYNYLCIIVTATTTN